jgi:hypothetical protein
MIDWLIDGLTSIYNIARQIERYRMTERFHGRFSPKDTGKICMYRIPFSACNLLHVYSYREDVCKDSHSPVRSSLYACIIWSSVINTHVTVWSLVLAVANWKAPLPISFIFLGKLKPLFVGFLRQTPGTNSGHIPRRLCENGTEIFFWWEVLVQIRGHAVA